MADVDEKVVKLTLDNKSFEKSTEETVQSLEELKKSLQFEGIGQGFEEITNSARKVNLNPLQQGVMAVSNQFNALATIADATLRNITYRAIDSGERLIKSLSVDQVTSGWAKFEDKTKSVATLLAQGFGLDEINEQLDKLNWFTDETSYNFTDMVANISKFTATGRGLEDSNTAMQGIALWAALSGQNAQTASHAMYQLSQALGAGTMRLEDYRSIQNASMDTDEFRQKALDAAVALGTLQKVGDNTYKSLVGGGDAFSKSQFATQLTEGAWFTSDVMMKVFQDYSAAVEQIYAYAEEKGITASEAIEALEGTVDSFGLKAFLAGQEARSLGDALDSVKDAVSTGWMKSFEYIIGDSKEATELFTDLANALYDVFAEGGNARNELLKIWHDTGGRDVFIESIEVLASNIYEVVETIKDAWSSVFPPMTIDRLNELTIGFAKFVSNVKMSETTARSLSEVLKVIFNLLKGFTLVFKTVVRGMSPIWELLNKIGGLITGLIGDLAKIFNINLNTIFSTRSMDTLYTIVYNISKVIADIAEGGLNVIVELVYGLVGGVQSLYKAFQENGFVGIFDTIINGAQDMWNAFTQGETVIGGVVGTIINALYTVVGVIALIVQSIFDLFTGKELSVDGIFSGFIDGLETSGLRAILDGVLDVLGTFITGMSDFVKQIFDIDFDLKGVVNELVDTLGYLWGFLKQTLSGLTLEDIKNIAILAMLWYFVDSLVQVNKSFSGAVSSFGGVMGTFNKVLKNFTLPEDTMSKVTSLAGKTQPLQMAAAVMSIVYALKTINEMGVQDAAEALLVLGSAVGLLYVVVKKWGEISASMPKKEKKEDNDVALATLEMGAALLLVAKAAETMSKLGSIGAWAAGLGGVTLLLGELVGVQLILSKFQDKDLMKGATSLLAFSGAVWILSKAVGGLAKVAGTNPAAYGNAILGLSVMIVALASSCKIMGNVDWKSMLTASIAITSFTVAIGGLVVSVGALVALSTSGKLVEAITALGGLTLILMAVMTAMSFAGESMKGGKGTLGILALTAALPAFSLAILGLTASLAALSAIPYNNLQNGMIILGIAIATFTVAMVALGMAADKFAVGFGIVIALLLSIAAVVLSFGASVLMFANAVKTLVETGILLVTFITAFGIFADKMGVEFPEIMKNGIDILFMIIREFLRKIPGLAVDIGTAVFGIIMGVKLGLFSAFTEILKEIPSLAGDTAQAIAAFFDELATYTDDIMAAAGRFIEELFAGLGVLVNSAGKGLIRMVASRLGGEKFGDWVAGQLNTADEALVSEMKQLSDDAAKAYEDQSKKNAKRYETAAINYQGQPIKDGFSKPTGWASPPTMITDFVDDSADAAVNKSIEQAPKFEKAGEIMGTAQNVGYVKTVEGQPEEYVNAFGRKLAVSSIHNPYVTKGGEQLGNTTVESATNAMEAGVETFANSAGNFEGAFNGMGDAFGGYLSDGMLSNIEGMSPELAAAMNELVGNTQSQIKPLVIPIKIQMTEQEVAKKYAGVTYQQTQVKRMAGEDDISYRKRVEEQRKKDQQAYEQRVKQAVGSPKLQDKVKEALGDAIISPSEETGEEAGFALAENLGKALGASGAGAAGAKTQAEKIKEAFDQAFEELSADQTTEDLLYKLWGVQNPNASDAEKTAREIEYNNAKLVYATKELSMYGEIYSQVVDTYGKDSMEATKAFQDYMQAQIDVIELQNKISEMQQQNTESNRQAFMKFSEAVNESYAYLKAEGFSDEQIRNALANEVGWKQPLLQQAQNLSEEGKAAATASANGVAKTYADVMIEGVSQAIPRVSEVGKSFTTSIATGMKENAGILETASNEIAQTAIDNTKPSWLKVGEEMDYGMELGIISKSDQPINAADKVTKATVDSAKAAAEVHSPSKPFVYIGEMMMEGMRVGIMKRANEIAQAAANAVYAAIRAAKAAAGIASPSKEGVYIGEMFDIGIVKGLDNYGYMVREGAAQVVEDVKEETTKSLTDQISDYIKDRMEGKNETTLDFVADLDTKAFDEALAKYNAEMNTLNQGQQSREEAFRKQVEKLKMMHGVTKDSQGRELVTEGYMEALKNLQASHRRSTDQYFGQMATIRKDLDIIANDLKMQAISKALAEKYSTEGIVLNYTQNNTSPDPLNRLDIYRDTKRQLDSFKENIDRYSGKRR